VRYIYFTEEDISPVYVLKQIDNTSKSLESNSLKNEFELSTNEHADVKFFETTVLKDELGKFLPDNENLRFRANCKNRFFFLF